MASPRDVDQSELVMKTADELQNKTIMPEWAKFIKTGVSKEKSPEQSNWWFIRQASILRKVYMTGPVGVQRLRTVYGGRKNNGHQPSHFARAGGKVIRVMLQDLEKAGLIEKVSKPVKGRKITPEGQKMLDKVAKGVKV